MQLYKKKPSTGLILVFIDLGTETMPADYQSLMSFHYTAIAAHKISAFLHTHQSVTE